MNYDQYDKLFKDADLGVIICEYKETLPIYYINSSAMIMFSPVFMGYDEYPLGEFNLKDLFLIDPLFELEAIEEAVKSSGFYKRKNYQLYTTDNNLVTVSFTIELVNFDNGKFVKIFLYDFKNSAKSESETDKILNQILNSVFYLEDTHLKIQSILEITGKSLDICGVYVYELRNDYFHHVYEWANKNVKNNEKRRSKIHKEDFNLFEMIKSSKTYITNDISKLPKKERDILKERGVKSIVIFPLIYLDKVNGYIGFEDYENNRNWNYKELILINNIIGIVATLLDRVRVSIEAKRGQEMLKLINETSDNLIYVKDINNNELKFASDALAKELDLEVNDIIGKKCFEVLHKEIIEPCDLCLTGENEMENYSWDSQHSLNGKHYLTRNSIIRWIDNSLVHFSSSTDITERKEFETKLNHLASMDTMTNTYNRRWGYLFFKDLLKDKSLLKGDYTLCYIDIDDLKYVNDNFGHHEGDNMIMNIVELISDNVRKSDYLCRWGGDEFILLLNCNMKQARKIINKIQNIMEEYNRDKKYSLSFSYGLAPFILDNNTKELDQIIGIADKEMYENKEKKKKSTMCNI